MEKRLLAARPVSFGCAGKTPRFASSRGLRKAAPGRGTFRGMVCFAFALTTLCGSARSATNGSLFPTPFNTEDPRHILTPPAESLAKIKAPPGFNVSILVSEPEVQNPIAMTTDERGRLWVAENYTYAESGVSWDLRLRDRIVVFEDTKHNGHFDKRTVFWDGGQKLTSVEVGFGGVWVLCAPRLLFIPDRNGDLVPDGEPEVILDGWNDFEVQHNVVNGLKWGPDGWLYGRHGIQANSFVGKPETPASGRTKLNCCIWRFHPTRHVFEVVCQGTTNPWGMDWNEMGQPFFINTIIGHFWQVIPGAHYKRMYGEDFDPHVYELLNQQADHYHWETNLSWGKSRGIEGKVGDLGGGHAHTGLMIYQGGEWPERYANSVFTINLHGLRVNNDLLARTGSGYQARHTNDFIFFNDAWFRGVEIIGAPDGGAYLADWCDTGECHEADGVHRTSGRIYKLDYGDRKHPPAEDLSKLSDAELVELQLAKNDWFPRQARRLLQERAAAGHDLSAAHASLLKMFDQQSEVPRKLRAMWALTTSGGANESWLRGQLNHPDENVRVWAIKFLTDQGTVNPSDLREFVRLAREDKSSQVRLTLASTLQRVPARDRGPLAAALVAHNEDASDYNLPLMLWYGIEPMAAADPTTFAGLEHQTQIPILRKFIARRVAEEIERNPALVNGLIQMVADKGSASQQFDVLEGMCIALRGWRKAPRPQCWEAAAPVFLNHADPRVRARATELGAVFGDGRALDELRRVALDESIDPTGRRRALQTMIENRAPDLLPVVLKLLGNRIMAQAAVRGLATFNEPELAQKLIEGFKSFRKDVRPDVVATLTSRASYARALLEAVGHSDVTRHDISAYDARQIHNLGDPQLDQLLIKVWGQFRTTSEEKKKQMAALRAKLIPERLKQADFRHGRELFLKNCGICHRLYGEGAVIGPDLTGSGRKDLGYLLENVVDPSAVVAADYKISIVELKDNRILTGIVTEKKERTLSVQTPTEKVLVQRGEIESIQESALSMMPEGLLDPLKEDELRDLIGYLLTPSAP